MRRGTNARIPRRNQPDSTDHRSIRLPEPARQHKTPFVLLFVVVLRWTRATPRDRLFRQERCTDEILRRHSDVEFTVADLDGSA